MWIMSYKKQKVILMDILQKYELKIGTSYFCTSWYIKNEHVHINFWWAEDIYTVHIKHILDVFEFSCRWTSGHSNSSFIFWISSTSGVKMWRNLFWRSQDVSTITIHLFELKKKSLRTVDAECIDILFTGTRI